MTALTIFIIASAIILLLLIQKLTLRFVASGDYSITIDYSFFLIVLTKGDKHSEKKKKKRRMPAIKPLFSSVARIIRSSKITVNKIKVPTGSTSPLELDVVLETELYNIFFSGIILLYEELKRRIVK